jgi:hypothetical protein
MIDRIRQMYKATHEMEQRLGRAPTLDELAEAVGLTAKKVQWIQKVSWLPLSLESPVGDEEDSELGMFIEDEFSPTPMQSAYQSMLSAAKGLVQVEDPHVGSDANEIVSEFRKRYYDTQVFFDPFAGGKFANYLFDAHKRANLPYTEESSRYLIDEAQLFIDAAHSCNSRLGKLVAV